MIIRAPESFFVKSDNVSVAYKKQMLLDNLSQPWENPDSVAIISYGS